MSNFPLPYLRYPRFHLITPKNQTLTNHRINKHGISNFSFFPNTSKSSRGKCEDEKKKLTGTNVSGSEPTQQDPIQIAGLGLVSARMSWLGSDRIRLSLRCSFSYQLTSYAIRALPLPPPDDKYRAGGRVGRVIHQSSSFYY